jgi:hypothetical protein
MRPRAAVLAAILAFLLVSNLPFVSAQTDPNTMRVDSELSITSLASLDGSGSVTITLYNDAAIALRSMIVTAYDISGNQILESVEVRAFLIATSSEVMGRTYWGITIKETTNFSLVSEAYINDHTTGLLSTEIGADTPVRFSMGISGTGTGSSKIVQTAQGAYDTFAIALEDAAGYVFNGTLELNTRVTTYGLGSLSKPNLESGRVSALRLPWGTIIWYKFSGHADPSQTTPESLTYETISILDNHIFAFVVLLFGCYFILRIPGKRFDKYEKLHPRKFRKYAKPLMSVRLSSYVLAGIMVLLFLVPYIFSFVSPNAVVYGAYFFVLIPAAIILESIFAKMIYDKAGLDIPDESIVEVKQAVVQPAEDEGELLCKICYTPIDAGLDLFQCTCGLTMHIRCAEKAQACPQCGEPLVQLKTRSIQCRACGETFLHSGDEDSYSIQCSKCGAFQEEIKPGKNYLIVDEAPRNAFMMIRAMGLSNRPAMCLTTSFPGKIRSDYDLKDVLIKWFSDSTTDIDNLNPKELEGDVMETVSTFLMTTKEAGVLLDGIETLTEL